MKKLLTIAVCKKFEGEIKAPYDDVELLYTDGDYDSADIIQNALKQANGKYITFSDGTIEITDLQALNAALENATCDILVFRGGLLLRTQIAKSVCKEIADRMSLEIKSVLASKNFVRSELEFIKLSRDKFLYSDENAQTLSDVVDDFNRQKAKVSKETYEFARELLCDYLYYFYADAIMKVNKGGLESRKLLEFDDKLNENIVLYLALSQRLKGLKLHKLREKKFKCGLFEMIAVKNILK